MNCAGASVGPEAVTAAVGAFVPGEIEEAAEFVEAFSARNLFRSNGGRFVGATAGGVANGEFVAP